MIGLGEVNILIAVCVLILYFAKDIFTGIVVCMGHIGLAIIWVFRLDKTKEYDPDDYRRGC